MPTPGKSYSPAVCAGTHANHKTSHRSTGDEDLEVRGEAPGPAAAPARTGLFAHRASASPAGWAAAPSRTLAPLHLICSGAGGGFY